MRSKIRSFITSTDIVDAERVEARTFLDAFNTGYNITTNLVEGVKNVTTDRLAEKISHSITALGIGGCEDDVLSISKQGKYFNFLQVVSDEVLGTKEWDILLEPIATCLSGSKKNIQNDINDVAERINNKISSNINSVAGEIEEQYRAKMQYLEIQKLPAELHRGHGIMLNMIQEIKNLSTAQELSRKIEDTISDLDIGTPKIRSSTLNIFNLGKYLQFLKIISNESLNTWSLEWIAPFNETAKYLNESKIWYMFLGSLYNKLSEYSIQKDKRKYNVANIEDWGKEDKIQGILITRNNFKQFWDKIQQLNVQGYNPVKNVEINEFQLEA